MEIVVSLETTEYVEDQTQLTPKQDPNNEATPPDVIGHTPKAQTRAKSTNLD